MVRRYSVALALLLGTPALLEAQYFGQNKVQYESFDWKIIQTEHFDVHFYPAEREAAMDAALDEAAAARKEAESRWPEVHAVVEAHRRVREENHFGPRLAAAFETRRQP